MNRIVRMSLLTAVLAVTSPSAFAQVNCFAIANNAAQDCRRQKTQNGTGENCNEAFYIAYAICLEAGNVSGAPGVVVEPPAPYEGGTPDGGSSMA